MVEINKTSNKIYQNSEAYYVLSLKMRGNFFSFKLQVQTDKVQPLQFLSQS